MIKKPLCLLLAVLWTLSLLSGCAADDPPGDDGFLVAATFYPLYLAALNLTEGAEGVTLELLAPADTGCPHDYRLRPRDMEILESADLLIVNGAGLEGFLGEVADQFPDLVQCVATEGLTLLTDGAAHDHSADDHDDDHDDEAHDHSADEHDEGTVNPHAWVSVSHYIQYVRAIADALAAADPGRQSLYRRNEDKYCVRLTDLRAEMSSGLSDLATREMVTFHEAFSYFAQEFGLEVVATIALDPGTNPSPRQLSDTIDIVRQHDITALFAEPAYAATAAETIARETGASVYELNPVSSGPLERGAYEDIQRDNLGVLRTALG